MVRLLLPIVPMCKTLIIKLFRYNTDSTMDPKSSVKTRFPCIIRTRTMYAAVYVDVARKQGHRDQQDEDEDPSPWKQSFVESCEKSLEFITHPCRERFHRI